MAGVLSTLLVVEWASMPALAQVSSYQCDLLPAEDGWTHLNELCDAEQWIEQGWLHQHVDFCTEIGGGEKLDYTRSLAEYGGAPEFWVEWRMYTDGPSTEFP